MPLPGESVAPPPGTITDAALDHVSEPPEKVAGSPGMLRSMRTVLVVAPAVLGVQADASPALSVVRNWTSVCPSPLMARLVAAVALDHVTPASVELRTSIAANPEPPVSLLPVALIVTEATFCHVVDPPETVGAVGAVRSRRTVFDAPATAGAQLDTKPAASTARNCTSVSPWALITAGLPLVAAPQ